MARSSDIRLPATMNRLPNMATIKNHSEIGTPTATPPAMARRTKPAATAARSRITSSFNHRVYSTWTAK